MSPLFCISLPGAGQPSSWQQRLEAAGSSGGSQTDVLQAAGGGGEASATTSGVGSSSAPTDRGESSEAGANSLTAAHQPCDLRLTSVRSDGVVFVLQRPGDEAELDSFAGGLSLQR